MDKESKTFREVTVNSSRIEKWNIPDPKPVQFVNEDGSIQEVDVVKGKMIKDSSESVSKAGYNKTTKGSVSHSIPAPKKTVPVKHLKKSVDNLIGVIEDMQKGKIPSDKFIYHPKSGKTWYHSSVPEKYRTGPEMSTKEAKELGLFLGPKGKPKKISARPTAPTLPESGAPLAYQHPFLGRQETRVDKCESFETSSSRKTALKSVQKAINLINNEIEKSKAEKGIMGTGAGALGGGALGHILGGPLGAVAGTGLGALGGGIAEEMAGKVGKGKKSEKMQKQTIPNKRALGGGALGGLAGTALGGIVGGGPGAVAGGALGTGAGLLTAEKTKPKMQKSYSEEEITKSLEVIEDIINTAGDEEIKKYWQKAVAEPIKNEFIKARKPSTDFGGESEINNPTHADADSLQPSETTKTG